MNEMNNICNILPYEVEVKYDYIKVNERYICILGMTGYVKPLEFIKTIECFNKMQYNYCIYISKLSSSEYIKKITRVISNTKSEIKTGNSNQIDIEIMNNIEAQAKELRKAIQVDNQDIFAVNIFITINATNKEEMQLKKNSIINMLYVSGMIVKPLNFRQKQAYLSTLPINKIDGGLKKQLYKILTTKGIACIFNLFTRQIFATDGVYVGRVNNAPCMINIFNSNTTNHNMLVFGSSGAGKSFFVKSYVIKNIYDKTRQIIFDPEGEYMNIGVVFGGAMYTQHTYNIFDIEKTFIQKNNNFLELKINQIYDVLNYSDEYTNNENDIKQAIHEIYEKFGIIPLLHEKYMDINDDIRYDETCEKIKFPTMRQLIEQLSTKKKNKTLVEKLEKEYGYDLKEESYMQEDKKQLIIFNLQDVETSKKDRYIYMWLRKIEEYYCDKMLVYIDELWQCILKCKNNKVVSLLQQLYKTMRKRDAGIIAITQDIADIAMFEDGKIGKILLNNSYYKMFFRFEYIDYEYLSKLFADNYSKYIMPKLKQIEKGSAIVDMGGVTFKLDVVAMPSEKEIIENGRPN